MSLGIPVLRGPTIPLGKRGEIVGLSLIAKPINLSLRQISTLMGVPKSAWYRISKHAKARLIETGIPDLCHEENLAPVPQLFTCGGASFK